MGRAGDHFETRHRRKDGTQFEVEISTNAAEFGGRKLVFCICRIRGASKPSRPYATVKLSIAP